MLAVILKWFVLLWGLGAIVEATKLRDKGKRIYKPIQKRLAWFAAGVVVTLIGLGLLLPGAPDTAKTTPPPSKPAPRATRQPQPAATNPQPAPVKTEPKGDRMVFDAVTGRVTTGTTDSGVSTRKINPGDADAGSPERAFLTYLAAWQRQDWSAMANVTQRSWHQDNADAEEWLSGAFDFKALNQARITDVQVESSVLVRVMAEVRYTFIGTKTVTITGTVIRESPDGNPSEDGKWGVNPVSTLSEEP